MLKILGIIFLAFITLSASAVVGTSAYLFSGGIGVCDVETPEVDLTIPVPMRLADIGLSVARFAMPREELYELRREVGDFSPLVEEILTGIAEIPEGATLVSVETPTETVHVGRRGGSLRVDVEAEDAIVHVKLPVRSVKRIGKKVGDLLEPPIL